MPAEALDGSRPPCPTAGPWSGRVAGRDPHGGAPAGPWAVAAAAAAARRDVLPTDFAGGALVAACSWRCARAR